VIRSLGSGSFVLHSGGRHLPTSLPTIWLLQTGSSAIPVKLPIPNERERERDSFPWVCP
jgi:hypothetical protein